MMLLSSCMQEEEGWPGLYYRPRPSKRDVLLLATVAAVLSGLADAWSVGRMGGCEGCDSSI